MARFYAQVFTIPFVLLGVAAWFLGDFATVSASGEHHGNLGTITLQLTWFRDALDLGILALLVVVGFVARLDLGRILVIGVGALLVVLAVVGFAKGESGVADLHFPALVNAFDLAAGVLAVLAGLGTVTDEGPQSVLRA